MRTALIGLIISIALMFTGIPVKKGVVASAEKPQIQKVEQKAEMPVVKKYSPIDYLYVSPNLYFNHHYHMYYYRELPIRTVYVRQYRFPVLGRIFRSSVEIKGPQGRGIKIGKVDN